MIADPGETILENLEYQEIRQMLAMLKEDYRTVLVLRFISELTPQETARAMGRTEGAVRILQHRALVALRGMLNKLN
jgi:RNA polymerase sigma-70 factor (ECF subfamily)